MKDALTSETAQPYVTPYSVTTSSALSQDYFDTAAVLMDAAGDTVVPFLAGAQVNALVLSGSSGALSLLQPDPSQPSGWSMSFVPDPTDSTGQTALQNVQTVAAASYARQVWMLVILSASYGGGAIGAPAWFWLNWDPAGGWGYSPFPLDYALADDVGNLATGTDPNGNPYFYTFNGDNSFYLWSPPLGLDYHLVTSLQGLTFSDAQLVWDPGFDPNNPSDGGVWAVDDDGKLWIYSQSGLYAFEIPTMSLGKGQSTLWAGWALGSSTPAVAGLVQGDGNIYFSSQQSPDLNLGTFPPITPQQLVPWFVPDGIGSVAVLAPDTSTTSPTSLLTIVEGYNTVSAPEFNTPIPIDNAFQAVFGVPGDPAASTLFAIGANLTLWVLTRDPNATAPGLSGVWTSTQIVQAGVSAQELTNWRTQITVTDANGIGVAGAQVQVTPDRTVGVWQTSGSIALTPQNPQNFTTNDFGQITLAVVTWELEAPQWTVQLLDQSSNPSGAPISAMPDGDVHSYLAGTGSLPTLGTLSGAGLLAATNPDDPTQPLSSTLASLPSDSQQSAAAAVVSGINQSMVAGLSTSAPAPNQVNSFSLDFSTGVPTYAFTVATNTASEAAVPAGAHLLVGDSDWWDGVKNDLHSLERAIRKGLHKVVTVVAQWSDDVEGWIINLAIDISTQVAQFVVNSVHSAITAIHGIFNAIAVDADTVVRWIRMGLDDVIGHAEANAQVVMSWIGTTFPAFATQQLDGIGALADGFFIGLQTDVTKAIDAVTADLGASSYNDLLATPSDSSAALGSSALTDITNMLTGVHHNWVVDKIKSAIDHGSPNFATNPTLQADMESASNGYQSWGGDAQLATVASNLWSAVDNGDVIGKGSDFADLAAAALFDALEVGIVDLLHLADDVVEDSITLMKDTVDGLADMLTTTSPGAQLIVDVLSKLGVHADLSFGHVAGMVAMFPTTLVYQLATEDGSTLFPSSAYTASASTSAFPIAVGGESAPADFTLSLKYIHALSRALLAIFQSVTDVNALMSGYTAGLSSLPKFILIFTPFLGFLISACTYPGVKTDGKTPVPFTTAPDTATVGADLVVAEMACGWALFLMGFAFTIFPPGGDSAIPGELVLVLNEVFAVGDLGVTSYANHLKNADEFTKATQGLERTPAVLTFCVFKPVVDGTDSISFFVKAFTDIGINLAAGGMLLDDAIKASG